MIWITDTAQVVLPVLELYIQLSMLVSFRLLVRWMIDIAFCFG